MERFIDCLIAIENPSSVLKEYIESVIDKYNLPDDEKYTLDDVTSYIWSKLNKEDKQLVMNCME